MSVSLRERRRQRLYDEILDATSDLMGEKGHELMSMDEVAARVGISKPTLYSYFATKDELIVKATVRKMNQVITFIEADHPGKTPLQRLTMLLHHVISLQIGDKPSHQLRPWRSELFKFLCEQEESLALMDRIDNEVVSLAEQAMEQGEIAPDLDTAIVVRTFYTMIHALNIGIMSKGGHPRPDTFADTLASIFRRGVGAGDTSDE